MLDSNYYNTTHETGQLLMDFTGINNASSIEILSLFEAEPNKSFTP